MNIEEIRSVFPKRSFDFEDSDKPEFFESVFITIEKSFNVFPMIVDEQHRRPYAEEDKSFVAVNIYIKYVVANEHRSRQNKRSYH